MRVAESGAELMKAFALLSEVQEKRKQQEAEIQEQQTLSQNILKALGGIPQEQPDIPMGTLPGGTQPFSLPQLSRGLPPAEQGIAEAVASGTLPAEIAKTFLGKLMPETKTPEKISIENLIADRIQRGEMTVEEGIALTQKSATEKEFTQTTTLVSPQDGKPHVYKYNPLTDRYDIDQGLASKSESDRYADTQVLGRLVDKFNADPMVRKVETMDEFANIIIEVAQSDNPVGHASLPTLMARASGEVGNLSEADKAPFGGSKALIERMNQRMTEIYAGKRTPENLAFINQLAETFRKVGIRKKTSLARERAAQYSKAYRGKFSEEEIFNILSPGGEEAAFPTPQRRATDKKEKTNITGQKTVEDMSDAELDEEIKRLRHGR